MISGASLFVRSGHALPRTWGEEEEEEEKGRGEPKVLPKGAVVSYSSK